MDNLFDDDIEEEAFEKAEDARADRHRIIVGTFGTEVGLTCLQAMEDKYVNISMYSKHDTIEDVAYRQAKADLVKDLRKELNNG